MCLCVDGQILRYLDTEILRYSDAVLPLVYRVVSDRPSAGGGCARSMMGVRTDVCM